MGQRTDWQTTKKEVFFRGKYAEGRKYEKDKEKGKREGKVETAEGGKREKG